ncbi:hypothetical protein BH23ACT9_BH23ACT9_30020 [soil metagenome]
MTARSWSCAVLPRRAALVLPVLLLVACVPAIPEPVVTTTTSPELLAIAAARDLVGPLSTQLAAGALDVARRIDFTRHEVARGEPMQRAVDDLAPLVERVQEQAAELQEAVADMDGVLEAARAAANALAEQSLQITTAVARDLDGLQPLLDVDRAMVTVIDAWDGRGSRSESAERFEALVAAAEALVADARRLPVAPAACTTPRLNRIAWAELLLDRTVQLQQLALVADGTAYDELRARFELAPFGEERVAADAEARSCWARHTGVPETAAGIEDRVADLQKALGG